MIVGGSGVGRGGGSVVGAGSSGVVGGGRSPAGLLPRAVGAPGVLAGTARRSRTSAGTTASTSSQAPSTSLGQCTTSPTRLRPTSAAQPPAPATSRVRLQRRRSIGQQTTIASVAAVAAAVLWP